MLKRWKSISCLATGGSSSNKVSQWVDQPLYPLTGNPLRVFGPARCTEKKVELVMKGVIGRKRYAVCDMNGVEWFTVERKSLHNWGRRVISDKGGTPICFIECIPDTSTSECLMRVWSLEGLKPVLVMEVSERKSRSGLSKRDELRATLQGNNSGPRRFLRIGGDLVNRMFGVSWTNDPKSLGHMVAGTWDVFGCKYGKERVSDAKYILEIPAGVDAAAMVALSVCIEERDTPCSPNLPMPIDSKMDRPVNAFGEGFIARENDVYVLARDKDSLAVINSAKQKLLLCGENGEFTSLAKDPVFQLTDGAFRAQGTDLANNPMDVSFLQSSGDGSFFRLALQCFSTASKGCRVVLIAAMRKNQQVVEIELMDKPPRKSKKTGTGLCIENPRPVIARAVLGSQSPDHFEDWYYDTIDSLFGSSFCIDQTIQHVGIGVEIAAGVDVALIFAAILVTIKYLPASFACAAKCGEIQPRGTRPLRRVDCGECGRDKSVLAWVEECVDVCRNGDYLLASHEMR